MCDLREKTARARKNIAIAAGLLLKPGPDFVKVSYPGHRHCMREVVNGCFVPILIAGGDAENDP